MNLTKKIFYIVSALAATAFMPACENYDDYMTDSIGYDGVYFPHSVLERSAIAGEGLKFSIGVMYGGVRENLADQTVVFEIDETLIEEYNEAEDTAYELLPEEYYTLSNDSEIIIPKGSTQGLIDITFNEEKCYADEKFLSFNYALPLKIVTSSADKILEGYETCIYPVKMMNTYEGYYYQIGQQETYSTTPNWTYIDAVSYGNIDDYSTTATKDLVTIGSDKVLYSSVAANPSVDYSFELTFNADKTISMAIAEVEGVTDLASVTVNEGVWNPTTRRMTLDYSYTTKSEPTLQYEVKEQLVFRNRIRDGLSEWRWEGFDGN